MSAQPSSFPGLVRHGIARFALRALLPAWLALLCALVPGGTRAAGPAAAALPAAAASAAAADPAGNPDALLERGRATLDTLRQQLQRAELDEARLGAMRRSLLALQEQAQEVIETQEQQLQEAQDRVAGLGPAASSPAAEPPDVAAQRQSLQRARTDIETRLRRARLLLVESEQLADDVAARQRAHFRDELFERTDSLLSAAFWSDLRAGWARDRARLTALNPLARPGADGGAAWGLAGAAALVAAAWALRRALGRALDRFVTQRAPPGRLRRSAYALARALLSVIVPGATAYGLLFLGRQLALGPAWLSLLGDAVGAVCFSAYVAGLGRALLLPRQPSWRLLPLPDHLALGLRRHPPLLGCALFASWALQRLAALVQSGLPTAVAIDALVTLALGLVLVGAVSRGERLRRQALGSAPDTAVPRPWWLSALTVGLWLLLVLSLATVLAGYVALGSFVVRQAVWISVLVATGYLLCAVVDDVAMAWRDRPRHAGAPGSDADAGAPPTPPAEAASRRAQLAVLASGTLRLLIGLTLLTLLLAPYGEGPQELLGRTSGRLGTGVTVGALQLNPSSVLQGVLVFALALAAVRALQRWLAASLLPTTTLDAGMRSSLVTLLGFVGAVVAVALGLSAVGLALDKVAWIASALTVGVGFGMQAIVSNFVSGLILLAERPVKVGDWVSLGGVEGDIRRINVRATEIRMGDRSTVIVPNSEFITKVVRNVTHDNPLGLVQVKLPLPLADTDVEQVRALLLQAFRAQEQVLAEPAPNVLIDGVDGDKIVFNATGFVSSPRQAAAARSAVLFGVLAELRRQRPPPEPPQA